MISRRLPCRPRPAAWCHAADQVLTREVIQGGKLGGAHGNGLTVNRAADQVAAFVVYDVRLHAGARCNFGGVEMGDQAQGGLILSAALAGICAQT